MPANGLRESLALSNDDGAIIVYVKQEYGQAATVSATNYDFIILPRQSKYLVTGQDGKSQIQDRYTVFPASGTPRLSYYETESYRR